MAVTQTGSILTLPITNTANAGTVSTTITVPSDAELAIVGVSGYHGTANAYSSGSMTLTKGGSDTAMTAVAGGNSNAGNWQVGLFYLTLPDTGSNKTLKWDWIGSGASTDSHLVFSVTFWKGVDTASPVRGTSGTQAGAVPFTSGTITATSGDLIVAWTGFNAGVEVTVSAWSNVSLLGNLTFNVSADSAWATSSPSGNTTVGVVTATNSADGGIVGISLKPAAATATDPDQVIRRPRGEGPFKGPRAFHSRTIEVVTDTQGLPSDNCCGAVATVNPDRPQYIASLYNWIAGAGFLALAAASIPCGEASAASPVRAIQQDVSYAPYNAALLTPTTAYLPCVVTGWSIPDGPPQTNRDWVGRAPPATVGKPFTQVDQSNARGLVQPNRDWVGDGVPALLVTVPPPPFTQVDRSNPRGPFQPNRDWINQPGASQTPPAGVRPPISYDWQLPRGSQLGSTSWVGQSPPATAVVVTYLPCVVTGSSIPDGTPQTNRDWVGRSPPSSVAIRPPAASCWVLPVRPVPFNTFWAQTPHLEAGVTYKPCVVAGWSIPDGPFQPRRDWFSTGVPAPQYQFRDPFLATRLTLQYDRKVHSQTQPNQALTILSAPPVFYGRPCQVVVSAVNDPPPAGRSWINAPGPLLTPPKVRPPQISQENPRRLPFWSRDWTNSLGALPAPLYEQPKLVSQENPRRSAPWSRDWINQPGALLTPPQVRPPLIAQENPKQVGATNRDWVNPSRTLPFPPPIRRTFDYPLPKQPPVTNRDWINTPSALRTPPAGIRPPSRYSWPLPRRVADTNRDWIGPDSVIRRVPSVIPPGATPGGGGLGFSYQRYERILEELYKKKKKLPPKAKKALAKAIEVVKKVDTSAADLARLLQALEAAAAASTQNALATINAANAAAEQARLILEQQRLRQLREEDDLILMMLDEED